MCGAPWAQRETSRAGARSFRAPARPDWRTRTPPCNALLYFTDDITANPPVWQRFSAGVPAVMIWDMQIDRGSTTLSLWTRGRGALVWPLPTP